MLLFGSIGMHSVQANLPELNQIGRLTTHLSSEELTREKMDAKNYPYFMKFIKTIDVSNSIYPTDPKNQHWIQSTHYFKPTLQMWNGFLQAAAADHLTCLRAFAILAREVKKNGMVVFGPGSLFELAVQKNRIDTGLSIPAKNLGGAIWSPDPNNSDPEFMAHIKIFYTEPFLHQFPDQVLPANLKIGYGTPQTYWMDDLQYTQPSVDADIYYGQHLGVGFRNIKGIGGQKRGVLGFFQKILFFLPDAIDSMTIHEDQGVMVTEALMNTVVKNFETDPIYSVKIKAN